MFTLAEQISDAHHRYGLGGEPYLLFVGDTTRNKGAYDLLKAYRCWRPGRPQIRLVFAGTNREGAQFLDEVQQTPGAIYLGHVSHRTALALIRGAEILVLPSRSEGLPRVILEAVAAPPLEWDSPLAVFEATYEHEQKVTGLINDLVNLAIKEKDHATNSFLQWFVTEQVEEEATASDIVNKLKLMGEAPGGLFMLDRELGTRVFTMPAKASKE